MSGRRLLDNSWDDDDFYEDAERAAKISVGIIIAIVVGIIVFVVVSVIVCIYCVCKKRQFSSGTVVQRGAPAQPTVTTYNFQTPQPQPGFVQQHPMPPPQGYPQYPPAGPQYPPPGPAQACPPMTGGGWAVPPQGVASPPPYTPQPAPVGFAEHQKASAPPME